MKVQINPVIGPSGLVASLSWECSEMREALAKAFRVKSDEEIDLIQIRARGITARIVKKVKK